MSCQCLLNLRVLSEHSLATAVDPLCCCHVSACSICECHRQTIPAECGCKIIRIHSYSLCAWPQYYHSICAYPILDRQQHGCCASQPGSQPGPSAWHLHRRRGTAGRRRRGRTAVATRGRPHAAAAPAPAQHASSVRRREDGCPRPRLRSRARSAARGRHTLGGCLPLRCVPAADRCMLEVCWRLLAWPCCCLAVAADGLTGQPA
jgi:hypothetical protein